MAEKRSELEEKDKEYPEAGKSWLRRLAEKGYQNYEDTVSGMNKGMNQAMMRLDPEHKAGPVSLDLPAAGTTARVWKAAGASPGAGGLVREGSGVWKKLSSKLGPNASDDQIAKAANNYVELWDAGKNTDELVDQAVRATKGEGTNRSMKYRGSDVSDEVDLLLDEGNRLNKVKKPEGVDAVRSREKWIDEASSRRNGRK